MGVYVKGMEMPFTCLTCEFRKCEVGVGDVCSCTKRRLFRFKNRRPSWCPFIHVPSHGRLIDADALTYLMGMDEHFSPLEAIYLMELIANAPTIIESEGEE